MKVARPTLLVLALGAAGCPSVETTKTEIASVEIVGEARSTTYTVHVVGRGFPPTMIDYSLSSGTGSARADLLLEVVRSVDGQMAASSAAILLSTRELDARPGVALPPAVYGVRLVRAGVEAPLAVLEAAFEVREGEPPPDDAGNVLADAELDGGVIVHPDAELVDGAPVVHPDAEVDGGVGPPGDAVVYPDADPIDGGVEDTGEPPDLGVPADSGLGVFVGNYAYRQEVRLVNNSTNVAPTGITFLVPIPHASMIAAGTAQADGSDIGLYYGTVRLQHAWEDRARLGTNQLAMIAQLPEQIAAGAERDRTTPLVLYYGDAAAAISPTDAVFTFVERFNGNLNNWTTRVWFDCLWDRSSESPILVAGAYCVEDATGEQRVTISSPRIGAIDQNIAPNLVYVVAFFLSGVMGGANDLVYFSVDDDVDAYDQTIQLAPASWVEYPPTVSLTFEEINNFGPRTVSGWRLPGARQDWTRAVARFRSPVEDPSLHLRFLSIDQTDLAATFVAVDDYTVRLALDAELTGTLDPVEGR